ncbi:hypothetical protein BGW80DRAFT_1466771 [Lactifluus volemus]|nr:hypothetical protein BGW80DRAFT_1466771 [Lactifluus volemus]
MPRTEPYHYSTIRRYPRGSRHNRQVNLHDSPLELTTSEESAFPPCLETPLTPEANTPSPKVPPRHHSQSSGAGLGNFNCVNTVPTSAAEQSTKAKAKKRQRSTESDVPDSEPVRVREVRDHSSKRKRISIGRDDMDSLKDEVAEIKQSIQDVKRILREGRFKITLDSN